MFKIKSIGPRKKRTMKHYLKVKLKWGCCSDILLMKIKMMSMMWNVFCAIAKLITNTMCLLFAQSFVNNKNDLHYSFAWHSGNPNFRYNSASDCIYNIAMLICMYVYVYIYFYICIHSSVYVGVYMCACTRSNEQRQRRTTTTWEFSMGGCRLHVVFTLSCLSIELTTRYSLLITHWQQLPLGTASCWHSLFCLIARMHDSSNKVL